MTKHFDTYDYPSMIYESSTRKKRLSMIKKNYKQIYDRKDYLYEVNKYPINNY